MKNSTNVDRYGYPIRKKDYIKKEKFQYINKKSIKDEMKDLRELMGKEIESPVDRKELVGKMLKDNPYVDEYLQSQSYAKKQVKLKSNRLAEEDLFTSDLDKMATYIIEKGFTKEDVKDNEQLKDLNKTWKEYSILSDYGNVKNLQRNLDISHEDPSDEDNSFVAAKGVVYINSLHEAMKENGALYRLSEDKKKKLRDQHVYDNLGKYPTLDEAYYNWVAFGEEYGFSDSFTVEERNRIQDKWKVKFATEKHPLSPSKRMFKLEEMYGHLGYELSLILKELGSPVEKRQHQKPVENNAGLDELEMILSLSDPSHVKGLLTIQSDKGYERRLEYYPLFKMLCDKHMGDINSPLHDTLHKFVEVVNVADLSLIEREIVELVMSDLRVHDNENIDRMKNPYSSIADYINVKYNESFDKKKVIHTINNKIVPILVGTCRDLEKGVSKKKCTECKVSKFASETNFGKDTRNVSGLKSVCKKCATENEKNRKQIV
jgi:hypothetical protein